MNVHSTVISEPVAASGCRYRYLGKTTTETSRSGISEEGGGRDKRVGSSRAASHCAASVFVGIFCGAFVAGLPPRA